MSAQGWAADVVRRLGSLLLLLTLVVGVPVALWVFGAGYLPDEIPSWWQVGAALSGPDTGAVFFGVVVVVGWTAWAIFALSVLVEIPAQLRGLPAPRLPALGSSQHLAGLLVAAVIGIASAPILTLAPASAGPAVAAERTTELGEQFSPAATDSITEQTAPPTAGPRYTVQPRDTLGRIADKTLGDWTRFDEIFQLNVGMPQPDGGELTQARIIRPGWVLLLPAGATTTTAQPDQVTVERGDTLSGIAAEQGLASWQPIFDLNAGEEQPGGRRFTDPNLIFPGQLLDIPAANGQPTADAAPATAPVPAPAESAAPPVEGGDYSGPQNLPIPDPPAAGGESPAERPGTRPLGEDAAEQPADPVEESPLDLGTTLAGAGALLAAGIGAAWLVARRQRFRRRRAGRTLTATPPRLVSAQTAVLAAARNGEADFAALDVALRSLAVMVSRVAGARLPDVVAARLTGDRLDLRLHAPADCSPPAPWEADDSGWWWSLDLRADSPVEPDRARARLAPYPALVSVGSDGGQRWLLDLERVGTLRLVGPPQRREDFARHLVAELAVNSWSDLLYVTTVGFGAELVDLNPQRLTHVDELGSAAVALQAKLRDNMEVSEAHRVSVLDGRLHSVAGDSWMPEILVVGVNTERGGSDLAVLTDAVHNHADRAGVAVVLGADPNDATVDIDIDIDIGDGWRLTLTSDGGLLIPELDIALRAPQLPAAQAADIAALLAFERDAGDAPIPAAVGNAPWQMASDAAGALLENVTLPRAADPVDAGPAVAPTAQARAPWTPAVPGSVLPDATYTYVHASAATSEDLQVLARRAPAALREQIEGDLPQLARDLADWWDPDCDRPRLSVLGPVVLRAHGEEQAVVKSGLRSRSEEIIAYLAIHEQGATGDQLAAALRPDIDDPADARAYVHRITAAARAWLGKDQETEQNHLSTAKRGPYTLRGVLVDAELFRQLRCRSGVRGRDGMADLQAALELVTGPPFAQRTSGYGWLDGLEETYTAMVCDVAHLVVTAALADGDLEVARAANEAALRVAPQWEKGLLDAMWVAFRDGNGAEAEAWVSRIVKANDGDDELDLHLSTAQTIDRARHEFLTRAS